MTSLDPFPPAPRVHYRHAPLIQVLCQVRYPAILRIGTEPPAQFQEAIRDRFPLLERAQLPPASQISAQVMQILGPMGGAGWSFLTENRAVSVGLSPDSMSLTVSSYEQWEDFRTLFLHPFQALTAIYKPAFFTRIGLRYVDLIVRSKVGLLQVAWSQLLSREILGELASPEVEQNLLDARRVLRVAIPSIQSAVLLQHGLAEVVDTTEPGYIIDLDFSSENRTEAEDVESVLDLLHGGVGRAFRWCISDTLHQALDPTFVGDPDDKQYPPGKQRV